MSDITVHASSLVVVFSCLLAGLPVARAGPTILNGGFEQYSPQGILLYWEWHSFPGCENAAGPATGFCPHWGDSYVFLGDSERTSNHYGYVRQRISLGDTPSLKVSFWLEIESRETSAEAEDFLNVFLANVGGLPFLYPSEPEFPFSNRSPHSAWGECGAYVERTATFLIPPEYRNRNADLTFGVITNGTTCTEGGHETIFRVDDVEVVGDVPTVSTWGLAVLGLLIVTTATVVIRRQRRAAQ